MSPPTTQAGVGLPEALERAASALPEHADAIRPANGDPTRLIEELDPQAASAVLAWLLAHEPEDGAELAEAWAADPERGAEPILRLEPETLPKAGRKRLRRVLHGLRSRGVELPEAPAEPVVARLPDLEDRLSEALVTPVDPSGVRAAYLVESHPAGGARLFEVLLDELRGVVELRVYSTGRRRARDFLRDFGRAKAVAAPPASVRALVGRIAAGQAPDRPLPRSFREWRARVAAAPEGTPTPGELARAALADAEEPAASRRIEAMVRGRELGPWPPPAEALEAVARKLEESAEAGVAVSEVQRRERAAQLVAGELDTLFAEPVGELTARRFEETAYVLWQSEREEEARACLAVATAFRSQPPADNPVARAMVEVVLQPVIERAGETPSERPATPAAGA